MRRADLKTRLVRAEGTAVLRNVRIPTAMSPPGLPDCCDGLAEGELWLANGRIETVNRRGRPGDGRPEIDLSEAMVWAMPVDCHTHADKGQTWGRARVSDGTFRGALEAARADRIENFDPEDLRSRARFILECAVAHGTAALRTHFDAVPGDFDSTFDVMADLADEFQDRMHVQLAPFTGLGEDPDFVAHLSDLAGDRRSGVLSVHVCRAPGLEGFLDLVFHHAARNALELDFHADETLDPASDCLGVIAETALLHRFDAPILVGHACSLSVQPRDVLYRTLSLVREAEIGIVALPLCNAYLQDRRSGSPRWRGIAPVHEIAEMGIPVAIASDNVRDPFHGYGDMDLPELYRMATCMMQLDHPVDHWPASVSTTPAAMIGRPELGRLGDRTPANMLIFPARNWSEFCARASTPRIMLRNGLVQSTEPPCFSRLDGLKGMKV